MKRIPLIGLVLVTAGVLFANGANGGNEIEREPVWNPVEMTGTISIVDDYPVLTARGTTYLLGAPRTAWYIDAIEDGQTVTIRGHLVEDPRAEVDIDVDAHVEVDQPVVDGEVIALGLRGPALRRRPAIAGGNGPSRSRRPIWSVRVIFSYS
ncbi:MAG: hypothetical protein ACOC2N_07545 [Spirochaetota bacterium]